MPSPTPRYQAAHSNGGGSGGGSHGGGGAAAVARVRTALLLLLAAAAVTSLLISGRHTRMHAAVFSRRLPERPGHNASSQPARSAAAAPTGGVRVGNGSIPRIIHQNFLGGQQQLLVEALKPLSHFRKEWWQSCKVCMCARRWPRPRFQTYVMHVPADARARARLHTRVWQHTQTHHPGWQHMFWDAAACEDLLQRHYAWFLSTWRALDSTVLKSGALQLVQLTCVCARAFVRGTSTAAHASARWPSSAVQPKRRTDDAVTALLPLPLRVQMPSARSSCTTMVACTWTWTASVLQTWGHGWRVRTWCCRPRCVLPPCGRGGCGVAAATTLLPDGAAAAVAAWLPRRSAPS
jgi:hypothetical protein